MDTTRRDLIMQRWNVIQHELLPELRNDEAIRHNERTAAERSNGRLKDEFGGNTIMVKGATKVMGHLMFGVLALTADQLMRLRQ